MNLVRMGHYHTPSGENEKGSCQTAIVAGSSTYDKVEGDPGVVHDVYVNLLVIKHDGVPLGAREDVMVSAPREFATFHLSGDCPWGR